MRGRPVRIGERCDNRGCHGAARRVRSGGACQEQQATGGEACGGAGDCTHGGSPSNGSPRPTLRVKVRFKSRGGGQAVPHELSIGEVARASGLRPSALRYYERAGLLPAPPRRSRQRRYGAEIFGRIERSSGWRSRPASRSARRAPSFRVSPPIRPRRRAGGRWPRASWRK
ncbi:MAG TPA: MerR family DNA-binding transcriptional regulator [Steroidobacteraceae bacterium]|nr:MerR family DNA-binding transcriptional regulator [Steroidobacteraceae bacterium]